MGCGPVRARPGPGAHAAEDTPEGEPVVSTYHAYAARLVADHALREALEPSLRLITPAVAWQIAARVVAAYSGPMDAIDRAPQWVTAAVLDLAAELAEHLRTPADVHQIGRWLDTACQTLPAGCPRWSGRSATASAPGSSCCRSWPPTRRPRPPGK